MTFSNSQCTFFGFYERLFERCKWFSSVYVFFFFDWSTNVGCSLSIMDFFVIHFLVKKKTEGPF